MKTKVAVIYHRVDCDGIMSLAVCRFGLRGLYDIDEIGWHYGDPVPERDWSLYERIYMVDICIDQIVADSNLWSKLIWIDHHISSIEKFGGQDLVVMDQDGFRQSLFNDFNPTNQPIAGIRMTGIAACALCWQWFFRDRTETSLKAMKAVFLRFRDVPWLLELIARYDVFDRTREESRFANLALWSEYLDGATACLENIENELRVHYSTTDEDPDDDEIRAYGGYFCKKLVAQGSILAKYIDRQNTSLFKRLAYNFKFRGIEFCVANTTENSYFFEQNCPPENKAEAFMRFTIESNGEVTVSMYHRPGFEHHDLAAIAASLGGGGHKGACGFNLTKAAGAGILTDLLNYPDDSTPCLLLVPVPV